MMKSAQQLTSNLNANTPDTVLLQIGLDLIGGWSGKAVDRKVALGEYDANIRGFCAVWRYFTQTSLHPDQDMNSTDRGTAIVREILCSRPSDGSRRCLRNCGVPMAPLLGRVARAGTRGTFQIYVLLYA